MSRSIHECIQYKPRIFYARGRYRRTVPGSSVGEESRPEDQPRPLEAIPTLTIDEQKELLNKYGISDDFFEQKSDSQIEKETGEISPETSLEVAVEMLSDTVMTIVTLCDHSLISGAHEGYYLLSWDEVKELEEISEIRDEIKARDRRQQEMINHS